MRFLRWLGVIGILCVIAVLAFRLVPLGVLRGPASRALSSALDRPVRIDGDVNIEIDLDSHIEIDRVSVELHNGHAEFARIELEFELLPLFRGAFEISEIGLFGGNIEIDGSGEPEDAGEAIVPGEAAVPPESNARSGIDGREPASRAAGLVELEPARLIARDVRMVHTNRAGLKTTVVLDHFVFALHGPSEPMEVGADGRFDGRSFDFDMLLGSPVAFSSRAEPFPIEISGSLDDLDLSVRGGVANPADLSGLDLAIALDAPSVGAIRALAGRGLDDVGPIHIEARLTDADGLMGIEGVVIHVGDAEDPIELIASGDLDDLSELDEILFTLELRARDLDAIGELIGVDLPVIGGGVSFTGSFRGSDERLVSEKFELDLDTTNVWGSLSGGFVPGRRPTLVARLESSKVHLDDIGITEAFGARSRRDSHAGWNLDTKLPFDRLPEFDARISLRADEIHGQAKLMIEELRADFVLDAKRVALENIQVDFAGGSVRGGISLERRPSDPRVTVKLTGSGVRMHRILAQFEAEPSLSGLLDASIALTSHGPSLRALKSNLSGDVRFLVRKGHARSAYANSLEGNLLKAAFGKRAPKQFDEVRCLLGDLRAQQGLVRIETLWLETDETTIRAEGRLDLRADTYDMTLVPKPKKRGLLSYAAHVKITGPFADPVFEPDHASVAVSAVKGLVSGLIRPADVVLEPVMDPVLAKLFDRRGGGRGLCAGVLEAGLHDPESKPEGDP